MSQDNGCADGACPSSPGMTKRHRAGPSRLDQTTWPKDGEDCDAVLQSQQHPTQLKDCKQPHAQAQLSQPQSHGHPQTEHPRSHAQPHSCGSKPNLRHITPQALQPHAIPSTGLATDPSGAHQQKPARRVIPEMMPVSATATASAHLARTSSVQDNHSLNRDRNAAAGMERTCSQPESSSFGGAVNNHHADSALSGSSGDVLSHSTGDGVHESDAEGLEDVSGKVLTEFGSRGDLWWEDFIAAKEEMLTDVLQVGRPP